MLSLWAFLAVSYDKLNALTFSESLVTFALDSAEMSEYVWAAFALNESKSFIFVEPLNCSSNFV